MSGTNGNGNGRGTFSLKQARELTPAVSPLEAMRRQMQLAVFDGVKESDVKAIVEKLKSMAMDGDHKAMKMFLELTLGKDQPPPPPAKETGGVQIAEALRDLVDEIRVARARTDTTMQRELAALPGDDE